MTSASLWVQGARPRTLGAAVAPVLVGTSAAVAEVDGVIWWRVALALVVALALQVGVNYANDYSDGVRGTDQDRKGPLRLTATGTRDTRRGEARAAVLAFGVAAVAGLVLSLVVEPVAPARRRRRDRRGRALHRRPRARTATSGSARSWCSCSSASWRPSAPRTCRSRRCRRGVVGIARRRAARVRDPPRQQHPRHPDRRASTGKRTLAVRVGADRGAAPVRRLLRGSFLAVVAIGVTQPWALLGLLALPLAVAPVRIDAAPAPIHRRWSRARADVEARARRRGARERGPVPVLSEHRLRIGDAAGDPARGAGRLGRVLAARRAIRAIRGACRAAAEEARATASRARSARHRAGERARRRPVRRCRTIRGYPRGEGEGARPGRRRRSSARCATRSGPASRCASTPTARGTSTPRSR